MTNETNQLSGHPEKTIQIQIDREHFRVSEGSMTGAKLRALPTPPTPVDRDIFEIVPNGTDIKIEDADSVGLRNGMRFFTAPGKINPGTSTARGVI